MFYFDGEKEKTMDKVFCCNKCQLERINNRAEASYVCINCGGCEFVFFPSRDIQSGRIHQYSYKIINHLKVRLRRFQAVESENVPEQVYDIIKRDLRKRRIRWDGVYTTGPMPTPTNIMEILNNVYDVCLLHDFVATLRLSALPFALYFLSKLALWPPHFNSCSPCFP